MVAMQNTIFKPLQQFRQALYFIIPKRRDSTMDLLDALSSNVQANSVVSLSLNNLFRRTYNSVRDVIQNFFYRDKRIKNTDGQRVLETKQYPEDERALKKLLIQQISPLPSTRRFHLFGMDCTPQPRIFSKTLSDKSVVHAPNAVLSNKPITIGHQYSVLAYLPPKEHPNSHWVLPIEAKRVPSDKKGNEFGLSQWASIVQDKTLELDGFLCALVGDSLYGTPACQKQAQALPNTVLIARARGNRTFYDTPAPTSKKRSGHPKWRGEPLKMGDPSTHRAPDETAQIKTKTRKGKAITIELKSWHDMLMRGTKTFAAHENPFTLVQAVVTDEIGNRVFKHPLWLFIFGKRRLEIALTEIYETYRQRYDLEHYFRFGKQRLLVDKFQTPETGREENWWRISQLAYVQLYLCRGFSRHLPNHWEKYLPEQKSETTVSTPAQVQRDFARIVKMAGTPACDPKRRGVSPGRQKGQFPDKRAVQPIVFKSAKKSAEKNQETIKSQSAQQASTPKPLSYSEIKKILLGLVEKSSLNMAEFLSMAAREAPA